MSKKAKVIGISIIVIIFVMGIFYYLDQNGNSEIAEALFMVMSAFFVFGFIAMCIILYVVYKLKLYKMNKNIYQKKVVRRKTLPIYSGRYIIRTVLLAFFIFLIIINITEKHINLDEEKLVSLYIISFQIIIWVILYIKFNRRKMLYLYKDNEKVLNYSNEFDDSWGIVNMHHYFYDQGHFVKKKCECIKLHNNIEFYSCVYAVYDSEGVSKRNYIFSRIHHNNENNIDIVLNNNSTTYLNKDILYVPHFSNIPPFVISGEMSESICKRIEKICSDFFAKTRSKYVLIIKDGVIELGLESARFGIYNRIFNKNKTIALIDEAINEISNFLTQVKNTVENENSI